MEKGDFQVNSTMVNKRPNKGNFDMMFLLNKAPFLKTGFIKRSFPNDSKINKTS